MTYPDLDAKAQYTVGFAARFPNCVGVVSQSPPGLG